MKFIPFHLSPGEELTVYRRSKELYDKPFLPVRIGNTEKLMKLDYVGYVEQKAKLF